MKIERVFGTALVALLAPVVVPIQAAVAWLVNHRRPRTVRWVCACGYKKRETGVRAETRDCPYCYREIVPEVMRGA